MKWVWLIADRSTGQVSYVSHGKEDDEDNWNLSGPFAYTSRAHAEEAAKNPSFLPEGVEGDFQAIPVIATDYVQAIFNGFPPSHTDVFMLNGDVYPLTRAGAGWIDEALQVPVWSPLFEDVGGGIEWLSRVLEQVAGHLQMEMETIESIGHLNAEAEDAEVAAAAEIDQAQLLIKKHVRLAVVPEAGSKVLGRHGDGYTLPPTATFWLHTMGMGSLGLPELEFRHVPAAWVTAAGAELNAWAAYALDRGISEGDLLDGGGPVPLKYEVTPSGSDFWQRKGVPCLRLEVAQVRFRDSHKPHGPSAIH